MPRCMETEEVEASQRQGVSLSIGVAAVGVAEGLSSLEEGGGPDEGEG